MVRGEGMRKRIQRGMSMGLSCALLTCLCGMARAQSASTSSGPAYPVKPVRIINSFSPGGSLDLVARLLAKSLTGDLGQQFIVENRPGAGGAIGIDLVAKSKPGQINYASVGVGSGTHLAKWAQVIKVAGITPE